jgi:hypothetical protein
MLKICVDTSFLISFADDTRPNHSTAVDYFRHCVANGHLLCLSTLVVSEFEVGQPTSDLPLQHFHIIPFNFRHAVRSADYHKVIKGMPAPDSSDRHVVRNDLKILAQADIEQCLAILTEDANTLTRWADQLGKTNSCSVAPVLLKDGFRPEELVDPDQKTFGI